MVQTRLQLTQQRRRNAREEALAKRRSGSSGSGRPASPGLSRSVSAFPPKASVYNRGRKVRHPEARGLDRGAALQYARTLGIDNSRQLPDVDAILKRNAGKGVPAPVAITEKLDIHPKTGVPLRWILPKLGGGSYGAVFVIDAALVPRFQRVAIFQVNGRRPLPPPGSGVILKVAHDYGEADPAMHDDGKDATGHRFRYVKSPNPVGKPDRFVQDSLREATWHRWLDEQDSTKCIKVDGVGSQTCASDVVPDFYWAGMVRDQLSNRRFYCTIMGMAQGVTVDEYQDGKPIYDARGYEVRGKFEPGKLPHPVTAGLYVGVERAIAVLWLYGITHSDFHRGNQLYNLNTGKVTIIDFGQIVPLTKLLQEQVRKTLGRAIAAGVKSLAVLWDAKGPFAVDLQKYSNAVRARRNESPWYNPDPMVLRHLYNSMSATERAKVPALRRQVWKVQKSAPQQTTPPPLGPNTPEDAVKNFLAFVRRGGRVSPGVVRGRRASPAAAAAAARSRVTAAAASRALSGGASPMNINSIGGKPVSRRRKPRGTRGQQRSQSIRNAMCRRSGMRAYNAQRRACIS